jgi:hypothetical protein
LSGSGAARPCLARPGNGPLRTLGWVGAVTAEPGTAVTVTRSNATDPWPIQPLGGRNHDAAQAAPLAAALQSLEGGGALIPERALIPPEVPDVGPLHEPHVITARYSRRAAVVVEEEGALTKRPTARLLTLMADIVAGVAALHDLGIVHRDLKPANILLTAELRAKISDMGLAKQLDGGQSSFGTGGPGSVGWHAPEQLSGVRQTRSVDLFALGSVLFYCITGACITCSFLMALGASDGLQLGLTWVEQRSPGPSQSVSQGEVYEGRPRYVHRRLDSLPPPCFEKRGVGQRSSVK